MRARRGRRAFLGHSALADGRKKGGRTPEKFTVGGMKMGEVARGYEVTKYLAKGTSGGFKG